MYVHGTWADPAVVLSCGRQLMLLPSGGGQTHQLDYDRVASFRPDIQPGYKRRTMQSHTFGVMIGNVDLVINLRETAMALNKRTASDKRILPQHNDS